MINIMALCWPRGHRDAETGSHDGDREDTVEGNEKTALQSMGKLVKACDVGDLKANYCFDGDSEFYWQSFLWLVGRRIPCMLERNDQAHMAGTYA